MKCKHIMDKFLNLDDYNRIPLNLRFHFLICPQCKMESEIIKDEIEGLIDESPFKMDGSLSDGIMQGVRLIPVSLHGRISVSRWVGVGSIIFFSIVLINYSKSYQWLQEVFGNNIIIPINVVLGFVLSAYLIIFVLVNHSEFIEYINGLRWMKKRID